MPSRARAAALALAAVTVTALSGCADTVDGAATPAGNGAAAAGGSEVAQDTTGAVPSAPAARPFTTALDESPLDVAPGFVPFAAAAHPAGGFVTVAGAVDGSSASAHLFRVFRPADDAAPGGRNAWQFSTLEFGADVAVAPDGTAVVLGRSTNVSSPDEDLGLFAVRPGAALPEAVQWTHSYGGQKGGSLALSPDGATAYLGYSWFGSTQVLGSHLAAVDVTSGAVHAQTVLELGVPGIVSVDAVEARPAGGVTALVSVRSEDDGAAHSLYVVDLDADLDQVGDPVELAPDAASASATDLAVTADGTAVVAVTLRTAGNEQYRLVVVRDGEVADTRPLTSASMPTGIATDPTGRLAYVPLTRTGAPATLAAIDLVTGGTVGEVPLCATSASFADVELATDGASLLATGICDDREWASSAFLVG